MLKTQREIRQGVKADPYIKEVRRQTAGLKWCLRELKKECEKIEALRNQ